MNPDASSLTGLHKRPGFRWPALFPLPFCASIGSVAKEVHSNTGPVHAIMNRHAFRRRCSMRPLIQAVEVAALLVVGLLFPSLVPAQAPPSIQFFMSDGSLPDRQLRFTLTTENGSVV